MVIIANKIKVITPKQEASSVDTLPDRLSVLAELPEVTVQRTVAKNPNTPPKSLELLSHSSDKAVRKGVALNPNSAKDILLALAPQFPGDFYQNPAFDWLLLEDPNLLFNIGHGVLKNILKRPECPESFIKWAAQHGSEQEKLAVAMNRNTSKDNLRKLVAQGGKVGSVAECHMKLQPTAKNVDLNQVFSNKFKELLHELLPSEASELFSRNLIDLPQFLYLSAASKICICEMNCDLLARSTVKLDAEEIFQVLYECALYDMSQEYPEALPLALPSLIARPEFKKGLEKFMAFVTAHDPLPETAMDKQLLRLAIPLLSIEPTVRPIPERLFEKLDQLVEYTWASDSAPAFLHPDCPQRLKDKYAQEIKEIQDQQAERTSQDTVIKADKKVTDLINLLNEKIRNPYKDIVKEWRKNPDKEPTLEDEERLDGFISECRTFQYDAEEFIRDDCIYFGGPKSLLDKLYKAVYSICEMMTEDDEIFSVDYPSDYFLSILETLVAAPSCSEWVVNHVSGLKGAKFRQVVKAAKKGSNKDAISTVVENPTETFWFKTRLKRSYDKNVVVAVDKDDIFFIRDSRAVTSCNNKSLVARILGLSRSDALPEALAKRSKSIEWLERMAIARNLNTPSNVIDLLKHDSHRLVALQALQTDEMKRAEMERLKSYLLTMPYVSTDLSYLAKEVLQKLACTRHGNEMWSLGRKSALSSPKLPAKWINHLANSALEGTTAEIRSAMARCKDTPPVTLSRLATELELQLEVAENPSTPICTLEKFLDGVELIDIGNFGEYRNILRLIRSVVKNPSTPAHLLKKIFDIPKARHILCGNPNIELDVQRVLAESDDRWTLDGLLSNPATAKELIPLILLRLARIDENMILKHLNHPDCSIELLQQLSASDDEEVRKLVTWSPNISTELLMNMADDEEEDVRYGVAKNVKTQLEILLKLAGDEDDYVRRVAASNPAIPEAQLKTWAKSEDLQLKIGVALNSAAPKDDVELLLHEFSVSDDWELRQVAAESSMASPDMLKELSKDQHWRVKASIADNPATPPELLVTLISIMTEPRKISLASNPIQNQVLISMLAADKEHSVRCAVASNPSTHQQLLEKLLRDCNSDVRRTSRHAMIERGFITLEDDANLGFTVHDFIEPIELLYSDLSIKTINRLVCSEDWVERALAAILPDTPPYQLFRILEDKVGIVRQLAANRLNADGITPAKLAEIK
jgi:hypothetical protein